MGVKLNGTDNWYGTGKELGRNWEELGRTENVVGRNWEKIG